MNSGKPEQEFQRAGTGVPASRNRSSSETAGMRPYRVNGFKNFLLSTIFCGYVEAKRLRVVRDPTRKTRLTRGRSPGLRGQFVL
jgi:hypothetical protein